MKAISRPIQLPGMACTPKVRMEAPGVTPTGRQCLTHTSGPLGLSGKLLAPTGLACHPNLKQDHQLLWHWWLQISCKSRCPQFLFLQSCWRFPIKRLCLVPRQCSVAWFILSFHPGGVQGLTGPFMSCDLVPWNSGGVSAEEYP